MSRMVHAVIFLFILGRVRHIVLCGHGRTFPSGTEMGSRIARSSASGFLKPNAALSSGESNLPEMVAVLNGQNTAFHWRYA